MKKSVLLFYLAFCSIVIGQNKGLLRGFVADSTSGEMLPYANVYIQEVKRGASTDHRGFFIMASLPHDIILTVKISYIGFESKELIIRVEPYGVTDIKVLLVPASIQLQTIEKIGEKVAKENATDLSLQKIAIRDLETLPKGVELDIFRALQNLPGVQTAGDVSARFYVRGSSSNQNLVLLDNSPIYNPFHALGIFSAIDPDMVSTVEFYKGGFPAEYSGRLSSVLKVVTRDGNRNNISAKGSLSLLTVKGLVEGPIPSGSFITSFRKNYSDKILKKFRNDNSLPADFYDFFAKINFANDNFAQDAKFTASFFHSRDNVMNDNLKREDFKWSNTSFNFNYFQISDSPLLYQVELGTSQFKGQRIPNESGAKGIENEINDFIMRMDFNYVYDSKDEMSGGFKISEVQSKLQLENFRGQTNDIGSHGTNISAYLRYKMLRYSTFGADFGTRVNATRLAGGGPAYFLEPRLSLTYRIVPELALKASWGIYMQDLITISDENEVVTIFEPWLITPIYLNPSSAIHYISGIEYTPSQSLSFNLEGYYKVLQNLAIINDRKYFPNDPDFVIGQGESYGLEFQSRFMQQPFNFSASYSLAYAFNEVSGVRYAPRYDSRHTVNLSCEYDFGSGWTASVMWTYSSGLPFTQIAGYYDRLTIDDLHTGGNFLDSYNPFILLSEKNLGRLPDYHRLDLSLSKKIQIGKLKLYFDISALNVYNRKNLFYFKRDTGERVDMLPFLPTATVKVEL
ncbi:MAG: TonB-dependent receptor [Melioribacteraceae bacterium]|nr:TonB-dependent receptor [Melioribacteraceae bacterium]